MVKPFVVAMLLLLYSACYAQNDFRQGYYISHQNDTTFGLVNYSPNFTTLSVCRFKKSETDKIMELGPTEIYGYGYINDKFLEAKSLESINNGQKVFVEVVVKGRVSLLKYEDDFYVEKDNVIHRLYITYTVVKKEGVTYKNPSKHHLGILNSLMNDCEGITPRIARISLREKSLSNLVEYYNQCVESTYTVYKESKSWIKPYYEVMGGYVHSNLKFIRRHGYSSYPNARFTKTNNPTFGFNFGFSSPRISERFSMIAGIYYCRSDHSSVYVTPLFLGNFRQVFSLSYEELKVPVGFKYNWYTKNKFNPYINFGVSKNILLKEANGYYGEYINESGEVITLKEKDIFKTDRTHGGFWGGTGAQINLSEKFKGFLEVRYEYTSNIGGYGIQYRRLKANVTNYYTLVGIRF